MLESAVENYFKERLERHGFKVIKFTSPGYAGVMDRIILRPTWSPGPPYFCEIKRPKKDLRKLQQEVAKQFKARGCIVLDVCDTYDKVLLIEKQLLAQCVAERIDGL